MAKAKTKAKNKNVQSSHKETRPWSPSRPVVPDHDDLYEQIIKIALEQPNTIWGHANKTGLSTSTISNHLKGKVKHPKSISLQMWARSLGGRLMFVRRIK